MQDSPIITTIIPTYKRPQMLKRAINSVLQQTFPHFKVCVYDNASGDETESLVRKMAQNEPRIHYHCHQKNIGALNNFQYGLMQVDTPYFSFLSDDDFLLPDFFKTAMSGFHRYPEAAFSAGSVLIMTNNDKISEVHLSLKRREGLYCPPKGLLETAGNQYLTWTGIVFRQSITNFVGDLDKELWASDLDFVSRIAAHHPFVISKQPCAVYNSHQLTGSAGIQLTDFWPSCMKMILNITEDDTLPLSIRNKFRTITFDWIKGVVFYIGIKSLEVNNLQQASAAAEILIRKLEQNLHGNFLLLMTKNRWPIALLRKSLIVLLKTRKLFQGLSYRHIKLQKEYGHYTQRLDT